jgi:ketosteroid isomerase-like protein
MADSNETLARRFHDAVMRKDFVALRNEIYAPDIKIWHNHDGKETTVDENISALETVTKAFRSFSYTTQRFLDFDSGFVMKFVMDAELHDGRTIQIPVCAIGDTKDGRITRFEEYYDTAELAPVFASLAA